VEIADLEAMRVGGKAVLGSLFELAPSPANSDYFPILDQRAPRARFRGDTVFELREMRDALEPVLALLDGEVRMPRERASADGRTQPPAVARAATALEALAIAQGAAPGPAKRLSPVVRNNALAAHALAGGCERSQILWLQAVAEVVRESSPHIAQREVAAMLTSMRASPCWKSLDETSRHRFALLEAINARDPAGIVEHARVLLGAAQLAERERSHYLVSAIAAELARGNRPGARELAARHAPLLSERERKRLIVQLALVHAFDDGR
jgi:spermidine synthase